ncbi:YhjD/YihY/BrkB family envelope integrity protein [Haloparvum sp. PAK95]|uniref:YihY/virulence factor BrkB family protein n=1 Tax=Haloparvum sp. PAK95 TaxID=3418962 RepID=UPI003D2EEE6C
MRSDIASLVSTVRQVVSLVQSGRVTFLAAGVAYYAFISLIPALLLLVVVASTVFGEAFAATVLAATRQFLAPAGQEAITTAVASAEGRGGATVFGVIVLLWSTLKVFRGLDTAFLEVYGVEADVGFLAQLRDATTVAVGLGVGLAAMVVVGTVVAAVDVGPLVDVVSILLLPALLTLVFLPIYYVLPYPLVTLREALPGAVVAAVGWTALQAIFQLYAAGAEQYQVYGVIGGILLLVTWLYVAALVVIVGAVVNVVLSERQEVGIEPGEPMASAGRGAARAAAATGSTVENGVDRQLQQRPGLPTDMGERDGSTATESERGERPRGAPDVAELESEVSRLRAELESFEEDVEERTVDRPQLKTELQAYVRDRMRRGHARGWGPYLVLLYGTVMTLGAFYFLQGIYAIAAMIVLGLSTLGLYTLFLVVGVGLNAAGVPGKAFDYVRSRGDD